MKSLGSCITLAFAALFSTTVFAHTTIGVFDLNRAIFSTEAWQAEVRELEQVFSEDQQTADSIREELAALMAEIENNAPVLTVAEIQRLQEEGQVKQMQLQRIGERVQTALQSSQNAFVERYRSLLGDAINEIYEEGGFDMILRSESIVVSGFSLDVTADVTARLNAKIAGIANGN
ncbi:MAG: OmpH family outer membrane protein [Proteobacteria bacterium]|nr:OmpH family outer membrane protein [Pseudomonadota bacterium]MDA0928502.1 OmpH family outer membrane protein [Pseudomonadota bacterium]